MMALDMEPLLSRCAPTVAPSTMRAIVQVESAFQPFVIGTLVRSKSGAQTLSRQPATRSEAVQWASWLLQNGYRFDAGPAQVNSIHFATYGLTPETAFEPCRNIAAGAAILTAEYRRAAAKFGVGQVALRAAISSYNTGHFARGIQNGYVSRVQHAATAAAAKSAGVMPPMAHAAPKALQ